MSLRDLKLEHQYRPNNSNLVDDFYIPCLSNSTLYQRAVGYFTSGSLAVAAKGLSSFVQSNGKMQLIASPLFDKEDLDAIQKGYAERDDVVTRALLRHIPQTDDYIINQRLGFLAWMITKGRLEIKIAITNVDEEFGIYHEKIGCFYDDKGNVVGFSGSSNETRGGLYSNFELIECFCSWRNGDDIRVQNKIRDFSELWNNKTKGLDVVGFPEAVKQELLKRSSNWSLNMDDPESERSKDNQSSAWNSNVVPLIPVDVEIREYQKEAVRSWFKNNGSGIFQMATGTGKTITSLVAATKIYETTKSLGLIIVCPFLELVEQWAKEAKRFGMQPIMAYESKRLWEEPLNSAITAFNIGASDHFLVITTNATFLSNTMQYTLRKLTRNSMLIADEAHHLGARNLRENLPENIKYRLGLSATPKRWFDEEGTEVLESYFAPGIIYELDLKQAIKMGFLTRYFYFPHVVYLTEEETVAYFAVTRKIAKNVSIKGSLDLNDPIIQNALIERSKIISGSVNKIEILRNLVEESKDSYYNIFYCGDAKVGEERQIEKVVKMIGLQVGMKVRSFTSYEDRETRRDLLEQFQNKSIQGLVAIRCLDEGVDIPATQTAYILSSSTNPREFIQRRGRVLRKFRGKDYATIHDFFVIPRELEEVQLVDSSIFNIERKLIRRELLRVVEFADLAENGPQAVLSLQEIKKAYNLLDI